MHDPDPNEEHDLDYDDIDELDEIGAGEQLVLVWCDTHERSTNGTGCPLGGLPFRSAGDAL